jgi:hypothetical protein
MTRLESLSPHLADKLRRASSAKQRAAGLAASEFAIARARIKHPVLEHAVEKVRAAGMLTPKEKAELDALSGRLDEEYFALQEAAAEGGASTENYMQLFGQARAVAALAFAGGEDAFQAATEAIYEAAATTDDKEYLVALIESALQ